MKYYFYAMALLLSMISCIDSLSAASVQKIYDAFPWAAYKITDGDRTICRLLAAPNNKSVATISIEYDSKFKKTGLIIQKSSWKAKKGSETSIVFYSPYRKSTKLILKCFGNGCGGSLPDDSLAEMLFQISGDEVSVRFTTGSEGEWIIGESPYASGMVKEWDKCRSEASETTQPFD